ncbi:MAG: GNAT family N-acetyltransferase [Clostridia bacterium]|nr:GNAT family N-acetyltransferase [Clostridia bacterium]
MIRYIKTEKEDDGFGVLLPVTVRRTVHDGTVIEAYGDIFDAVISVGTYDVFSEEYFAGIEDICRSAGYEIDTEAPDSHSFIYERPGGGEYTGAAVPLTEETLEYENLLASWDLRETMELNDRAYVKVVGGRIVSIAVGNFIKEYGDAEIAVETAEGFRKNGYARECINAVCASLEGRIAYVCGVGNIPSIITAEKCGFERVGTVKYFVAYED